MKQVNKSFYVTIDAKPEYTADLETLLKGALDLANREVGTITWYAIKLSECRYAIFDTFSDESSRQAHFEGPIAQALMSKAGQWLSRPPEVMKADVLAAKLV